MRERSPTTGEAVAPDVASSTDAYAARFDGAVGRYFLERQFSLVSAGLPGSSGGAQLRILDVGGGHAQLGPPLVAAGHDVTVVASDEACRVRPDRLIGRDRYAFRVAELADLPFAEGEFDVVLAFRLMAHVEDWRSLLEECCRVARSSLVFDAPLRQGAHRFADSLFGLKRAVERDTRPYRSFDEKELRAALSSLGWIVERWQAQFWLPMALHRAVGSESFSRRSEAFGERLGCTARFGSPVVVHARSETAGEDGAA